MRIKLSFLIPSPTMGKGLTDTNMPDAILTPTDNQPVIHEAHQGHL